MLFKDWKKAISRAPLHILMSLPFAAISLIVPLVGEKYITWRVAAENDDLTSGRDTQEKSRIDLYTQTALVQAVLWIRE